MHTTVLPTFEQMVEKSWFSPNSLKHAHILTNKNWLLMSPNACLFFLFFRGLQRSSVTFVENSTQIYGFSHFCFALFKSFPLSSFVSVVFLSVCLTWGCRGHVRLSCGWPPVDRSSGAFSRRQRRIYHKTTWSYLHCCCSLMAPSISSFCRQKQSEKHKDGADNTTERSRKTASGTVKPRHGSYVLRKSHKNYLMTLKSVVQGQW